MIPLQTNYDPTVDKLCMQVTIWHHYFLSPPHPHTLPCARCSLAAQCGHCTPTSAAAEINTIPCVHTCHCVHVHVCVHVCEIQRESCPATHSSETFIVMNADVSTCFYQLLHAFLVPRREEEHDTTCLSYSAR